LVVNFQYRYWDTENIDNTDRTGLSTTAITLEPGTEAGDIFSGERARANALEGPVRSTGPTAGLPR